MDTLRPIDPAHKDKAKELADAGVRYVTASWIDIFGRSRAKSHPVHLLPELMAGFARYTPRGINGIGAMDPVEEEVTTLPDLDTLTVLPWDTRFAWMAADMWSDRGEPFSLCPRSILKQQIDRAAEQGYRCTLGVEPEFYLYRPEDLTSGGFGVLTATGAIEPSPAYDVETTYDVADFLDDAVTTMGQIGLDAFALGAEGGVNQFEIDFYYKDLLQMADRLTLFRLMMHQVAKRHGLAVSFMPKPFANLWGSGAHFNLGLYEVGGSGESVLRLGNPAVHGEEEWSKESKYFVGGLFQHARALTAITNPLVNSYKRLTPRLVDGSVSWAPIKIAYGPNNRSCMIRLPENRPAIEVRNPDASANVYLAGAFLLAAGLDGIANEIDPGEPITELASDRDEIQRLPRTLLEAVEAFEADELSHQVFGKDFITDYAATKRAEWERSHLPVGDADRNAHLPYF
ncbi:glutamine synthetase family protein [Mycolicibacterium confluentis]|uniref:Type III glutamate--ammonia ligase n=1 Tax=Mycolicibacterium confluentis TaxID=28047 RepID=A0A7I7Y1N9_9MYCO|nr:glutamine synthetase family protein [Mycolicibacterium confluentis]MCV7320532.1 glutamate--ammonia ligase [Mycolicibacterium confluentis]ORV30188.1 glutamate--ammonia ligase [Mycolicibacterium confluentis]BBZ35570.1 type III glutamate--ammonia ligase [Mycolicibacterium confluentis]